MDVLATGDFCHGLEYQLCITRLVWLLRSKTTGIIALDVTDLHQRIQALVHVLRVPHQPPVASDALNNSREQICHRWCQNQVAKTIFPTVTNHPLHAA
jgi:hypothetical protein